MSGIILIIIGTAASGGVAIASEGTFSGAPLSDVPFGG